MRIAFISHWSGQGGAEKALLEIILATTQLGHVPFCFVPRRGGWLQRELERRNIGVIPISYPWWAAEEMPVWLRAWHLLRLPLDAWFLANNLRSGEFDLVYTNSVVTCAGALAARWAGIPHAWHIHEFIRPESGHQFFKGRKYSTEFIRRHSNLVIGASRQVLASLDLAGEVLYLPPKVSAVNKQPKEKRTLVCVGHFVESRRHRDAIEALRLLLDRGYDVCLRIVGDGPQRAAMERQAAGLPVTFTGMVADASQEIANADILVNCNSVEAFGRVNVEAMALSTPIVASASGANTEIIRHEENGLLFELGNPTDLADQVSRILDEPALAPRLVADGLEFVASISSLDASLKRIFSLATKPARSAPDSLGFPQRKRDQIGDR